MGCTRAELLRRISSRELSQWMAFYSLEPFGHEADLIGHAVTASTIANVNRPKDAQAYSLRDFMPTREEKQQTVEEQLQFAEMMTIALGGTVDIKDKDGN